MMSRRIPTWTGGLLAAAFACGAMAWPAVTGEPAPWLLAASALTVVVVAADRIAASDRSLFWIVTLGAIVKIAAVSLTYYVSLWGVPFLQPFQIGGGFWSFAPDGVVYDRFGAEVARAWQWGLSFPTAWETVEDLSLFVGTIYYFFGRSPLNVLVVNTLCASGIVLFAVLTVREFADGKWPERCLAAALAFWPSLILWSTQLLKDPPMLCLLMAELYFGIALLSPRRGRLGRALLWTGFVLAPFPVWFTRQYLDLAMGTALTAVLLVVTAGAVVGLIGSRVAWRTAALWSVFGLSLMATSETDYIDLLRPRDPIDGYMSLASRYRAAEQWAEARETYREALNVAPTYAPAFAGISEVLVAQSLYREAGRSWEEYSRRVSGAQRIEGTYCAAEMYEKQGDRDEADRLYRSALELDADYARSSSASPCSTGAGDLAAIPDLESGRPPGEGLLQRLGGIARLLPRTPEMLGSTRRGIVAEGGSTIDPEVQVRSLGEMVAYLPRGLLSLYAMPFPWQWFTPGQTTGGLRALASLETAFLYLLFPAVVVAFVALARSADPRLWLLATIVAVLGCVLAVAIPNVGTLFRLRLQVVFPLLVLVVASGAGGQVLDWLRRRGRRGVSGRSDRATDATTA